MLGDPALSKVLHQNKVIEPGHDDRYGRACKNYFIVSGFAGLLFSHIVLATLPRSFVEAASVSTGLALACGLGFGVLAYLVKRSYKMQYGQERSRESWEMENFPDGERKEMVELFQAQGLSTADATLSIETMSKDEYKNFFIDLMMMQEIGMSDPELEPSAAQTASIVSSAFVMLALWPSFVWIIARWLALVSEPIQDAQLAQLLFMSSTAVIVCAHLVMDGVLLPEQKFGALYIALFATSVFCAFIACFVQKAAISFFSNVVSA